METRAVFFMGKPGCGKGDQARLLSEKTGWEVVTAGEQFRSISAEDTPVGRKIKSVNDAGMLQPHWLAEYLFLKNLFSLAGDESVIFDGFGRKLPEAETMTDSLTWLGRSFSALYLRVSDEEILRRLALRKEIEGRADDSVVDERLKEYREHTEPVVEMFRSKGMLIEIDGERTRETIAANINTALNIK
ncbi:MAG: nucleoside monophosphate kinase [bacterium]|nr:nucleoside monophosphate kinase [bacterium]